jgi:hypothetical protein
MKARLVSRKMKGISLWLLNLGSELSKNLLSRIIKAEEKLPKHLSISPMHMATEPRTVETILNMSAKIKFPITLLV